MNAQTTVLLKQNDLISAQEAARRVNPEKDDFALERDTEVPTLENDPGGLFAQTKANMPDVWKKLTSVKTEKEAWAKLQQALH